MMAGFQPKPAKFALGMKAAALGIVVIATTFVGHGRAQSAVAVLATSLSAAAVVALVLSNGPLAYLGLHAIILIFLGLAATLSTFAPAR